MKIYFQFHTKKKKNTYFINLLAFKGRVRSIILILNQRWAIINICNLKLISNFVFAICAI